MVMLKPNPLGPFTSSISIFLPIFLVLAVRRPFRFLDIAGTFLVGDTVAIFVFVLSVNSEKNLIVIMNRRKKSLDKNLFARLIH